MQIVRIDPFVQPEMVEAIVAVYQEVFGGEPWNEGYVCPVCEKVFARVPSIKTCPECAERSQTVLVVEYWPTNKVLSDFYREMRRPEPVCVVAQLGGRVIGFAWGYLVSANSDLDVHLDVPGLHQSLRGDFFYGDECALAPSHQGKGIGKLLVSRLFSEQQQKQVLLRTMDGSRMCNLIKHMGGETIQHTSRGRVIMRVVL